uniref:ATP-dependent Clp protease proteolytic subunit n=1 Tax=Fagonia indica TaxID=66629 RepID=A0A6C0U9X4_9ROSI|nr:ATP-dependent Clp protease proteolytic subunit [Fagonia indica]
MGVYISECRHIQEQPIRQNFPLFVWCYFLFMISKCYLRKTNDFEQNQLILSSYVLTPKQSKIDNCIFFHFMPIGVPKVPFLLPGDDDASWIDLYNRLFQERLLFLGQEVNSEISNQLVGLMVYLSLEDKNKDLYLFINSPGGEVISGMAIFDTMQFIEAEVQTVCVGLAASMGSLLLVGGEITKRLAFPHAWRQ